MKRQRLIYGPERQAIYCDVMTNAIRPFLPLDLRQQIFDNIHNMSPKDYLPMMHLAIDEKRRITVASRLRALSKVENRTTCPRSTGKVVGSRFRFDHVHVDDDGPLP